MTYKDQWLSAAQVLRAQAIKFEEIAKSAPERPDIDPTEPDKFFFITQLREAVGLPVGALPISPKQAWEEAIAKVKAAPCEHPPGARAWKFDGAFQCVECGAQFDGCICSYGNTLHGDWVRVPEADCPAHIEGSGRET